MFVKDLQDHDDTPVEDETAVLRGLSWSDYQRQLELRRDRPVRRFAYLEGDQYLEAASSAALPGIDLVSSCSFLDRPTTSQAIREYRTALAQNNP